MNIFIMYGHTHNNGKIGEEKNSFMLPLCRILLTKKKRIVYKW